MLRALNIEKTYGRGHTTLTVLKDLDFTYNPGDLVGVFGASGTGKSTLLHIIGGLDRPTSGNVLFEGEDLFDQTESELARYRNRVIGFVFQFYHLLPEFTAEENVMIPSLIGGASKREAKERAGEVLSKTGLYERRGHKPSELSGGEQQRVAIGRAIVMNPRLLLADEPTGNLDKETGRQIMDVLLNLHATGKMGLVMVTHDQSLIGQMSRKLELKDGRLWE